MNVAELVRAAVADVVDADDADVLYSRACGLGLILAAFRTGRVTVHVTEPADLVRLALGELVGISADADACDRPFEGLSEAVWRLGALVEVS